MGDVNKVCEGLTTNNYICMESGGSGGSGSGYTINTNKLKTDDNSIAINDEKTEISLTGNTSNHYFYADEKAHCYEKWEDWFCVPNYHNDNKTNKYPETETMSVGLCYSACPAGYTQSKIDKCIVYDDEEDLLYNPLAIIAMFGTNLYFNTNSKVKIANYNEIMDTVGIRGSYLNDLYRVNNNNEFIPRPLILNIYDNDKTQKLLGISKQECIIIDIIKKFVRNEGSGTILAIKANIKKATEVFVKKYVDALKFSKVNQSKLLTKIKDYSFDIEKLDKIFGLDKCKTSRLKNVISYCFDISRAIFYTGDHTTIDKNIRDLFQFNEYTSGGAATAATFDEKAQEAVIKIFKCACYNCFNVNYDTFNTYLSEKFGVDNDKVPYYIHRDKWVEYTYPSGFSKLEVDMDKLETVSSIREDFIIPYYNNISFYDHQLLGEYSENTQSVVYIILILAIFIAIIVGIWFFYIVLLYFSTEKGVNISYISNFVNYCIMFYNMITYYLVIFVSYYYYSLLCKYSRSSYIIINLFFKFLNLFIIFLVASYLLVIILELLNMNLFSMLSKMNFNGGTIIADNEWEKHKAFYNYMLHLYLIGIYVYSMYITRYSLTDKEFDILTNVDAQEVHSANQINNLLLQKYAGNTLAAFDAVYSSEELADATEGYNEHIKELRAANEDAKEARVAETKAATNKNIEEFRRANGDNAEIPYYF
jgi:hypothetical protein